MHTIEVAIFVDRASKPYYTKQMLNKTEEQVRFLKDRLIREIDITDANQDVPKE